MHACTHTCMCTCVSAVHVSCCQLELRLLEVSPIRCCAGGGVVCVDTHEGREEGEEEEVDLHSSFTKPSVNMKCTSTPNATGGVYMCVRVHVCTGQHYHKQHTGCTTTHLGHF